MKSLTVESTVEQKILIIRDQKVLLDRGLAKLYGVSTKALNQAVKRNSKRFPKDFMFKLTEKEKERLVTICDRFKSLKHSSANPNAFTEQGVAMLSSVLNSERAIQVNIAIMRVFVKIREIVSTHKDLLRKLILLENKVGKHDKDIKAIFDAIHQLIVLPNKPKTRIGFHNH
ncbi:MAG: ORF6N domain-containing protein [Candidatus Kaelpia imicola]|nr:ORF6N domain-containing protein [Candidatus Kaelpia imicola]